jgi:hypothetical protein
MRGAGLGLNTEKLVTIFLWGLQSLLTHKPGEFPAADGARLSSRRAQSFVDDIDGQTLGIGDGLGGVSLGQERQQSALLFRQSVE